MWHLIFSASHLYPHLLFAKILKANQRMNVTAIHMGIEYINGSTIFWSHGCSPNIVVALGSKWSRPSSSGSRPIWKTISNLWSDMSCEARDATTKIQSTTNMLMVLTAKGIIVDASFAHSDTKGLLRFEWISSPFTVLLSRPLASHYRVGFVDLHCFMS